MFVEKTMEEFEALSTKEQAEYLTAKKVHDTEARKTEIQTAIDEAQKNNASKEDVEVLQNKLDAATKELEIFGMRMKQFTERSSNEGTAPVSLETSLKEAFEGKADEFKRLADGDISAVKAVVNITDATTIDAVGSASHYSLTTNTGIISKIRSRIMKYLSNVSIGRMSGNRVMWMEELNEEGTPIFIAEAATKTKISVRYEEREKKSKKIGVHSKVSTEFLRNLPQLVTYVKNNLVKRVDIVTEDQLFDGDDTGNNLAGLTGYATAFTGGSLAGTIAIPSNADVFRALALQVEEAFGIATAVFVRPSVLAAMDVEKSVDGVYLLPPFRAANGNMVAGMELISSTGLPSGVDFIGGDLSVVNVSFADQLTVQVDMSGTDFIDNLRTILVEQELVQWVSANDTQVLVQGDMATAITALTVAP